MSNKPSDCEAVNTDLVEKIQSNMPETRIICNLADFFKVMGDSTRIRLLLSLEQSEMCVGDLAVILNMTKSAVSHQLKVLRTAKLIKYRKRGKHVYYSLDDGHVKTVIDMALEHICE